MTKKEKDAYLFAHLFFGRSGINKYFEGLIKNACTPPEPLI